MIEVERVRRHPEVAPLICLSSQLELLPIVLAAVHEAERRDASADQARSMARVAKVLANQVRAYLGLIEEEIGTKRRAS